MDQIAFETAEHYLGGESDFKKLNDTDREKVIKEVAYAIHETALHHAEVQLDRIREPE